MLVVAWVGAVTFSARGLAHVLDVGFGYDSHAYWLAAQHPSHPYGLSPLARDAYLYSPLFVQVIWPVAQLPWPLFGALWSVVTAVVFWWLLRPLPWRWMVPAYVATSTEIVTGNVYALMALALATGVTRGASWVFPLMTKVTPAGVGVVWIVGRRSWRELAVFVGTALGLGLLSFVVSPSAWFEWIATLRSGSDTSGELHYSVWITGLAIVDGVALALVGTLRDRSWLLAVATIVLSPTLGPNTLTVLAAIPRMQRRSGASVRTDALTSPLERRAG